MGVSFIIRTFAPMNINHVFEKLGISELNAMQQEANEAILRGRNDVLVLQDAGLPAAVGAND